MTIEFDSAEYWQWDTGRTVTTDAGEVHFSNPGDATAHVVAVSDGAAVVPDELLQTGKPVLAYSMDGGNVVECARARVRARAKPEDYLYTETEFWTLSEISAAVQAAIESAGGGCACCGWFADSGRHRARAGSKHTDSRRFGRRYRLGETIRAAARVVSDYERGRNHADGMVPARA